VPEAQIRRGVVDPRGRLSWPPPSTILGDPRARHVAGVLLLAALYRGVAEVGYTLQFAGPVAAIVWLPVGVGIAFLYLGGLRFWPGVLLGDLLANNYAALPLGAAVGQSAGNVLETVLATLLLRRLVPTRDPLGSVRGVGGMLVAIGVGTAVSSTIGCLSLRLGGVIEPTALSSTWRTWWLGDATGAVIVVPLALAWARPLDWRRPTAGVVLCLAGMAALTYVALSNRGPYTYLVFPALLVAALGFGRRGATGAVAVVAGLAVWEATRRTGPFAVGSATDTVLATQLFIAVAAICMLYVAATASERDAFAGSLSLSRARLANTAADERRRIERDLHDGAQQRLTALLVRLQLAAEQARTDPATGLGALTRAQAEVEAVTDELRELAHGIHPSVVTDRGLADALRGMAATSVLPLHLRDLPVRRADATAEVTAYFLVAEAVTNARKHAHADAIDLWVGVSADVLRVEIADDGIGGAAEVAGSGIRGLRDRVEAIGGTFSITSLPGRGTRIVAELPTRRHAAHAGPSSDPDEAEPATAIDDPEHQRSEEVKR
jgi:signal transduction histidine kinase